MENIINDNYIYLSVPAVYKCVYEDILAKLADYGTDLVKDCSANCKNTNKQIMVCWNMFQAACAAYTIGNFKQATLLINYIIAQLKCKCTENGYPNPVNITDFNVLYELDDNNNIIINGITFTIDNIENTIPNTLRIEYFDEDVNDYISFVSNSIIISPTDINKFSLDGNSCKTYNIRMSVKTIDGIRAYSDNFIIYTDNEDYDNSHYFIYGNIDEDPNKLLLYPDICIFGSSDWQNHNKYVVKGNKSVKVKFKQDKVINYVLVPKNSKVQLQKVLYGDVPTLLWDINNQESSSYRIVNNVADNTTGIEYTLYFNYIPNSQFEEDIEYIIKNI